MSFNFFEPENKQSFLDKGINLVKIKLKSLILAQDERWRHA